MDRRAVLSKSQDQQQPHMRRRDFDHSEGRGERNIILELGRKFTANSSSSKHYKVIGKGASSVVTLGAASWSGRASSSRRSLAAGPD
jgi:hypothetical protein